MEFMKFKDRNTKSLFFRKLICADFFCLSNLVFGHVNWQNLSRTVNKAERAHIMCQKFTQSAKNVVNTSLCHVLNGTAYPAYVR